MGTSARYWPGGIPDTIRFHPQPILSSLKQVVKGWQLFLEENVVPRSSTEQDHAFETRQRQKLMQQWVSLTQAERDEYQSCAPVRPKESWYPPALRSRTGAPRETITMVNCIAPWPLSPRNRALWTKLRIMLYCLDGDSGALFGEHDGEVTAPEPSPAGPNPLTPQEFLKWCYVENANFDHIAMTSDGTVVCHNWQGILLFADQEALDTGLMLLCHIENNGQVMCQGRVWPVLMKDAYVAMMASGKPVEAILDQDMFKGPVEFRRVNMEDPIIDILESQSAYLNNADIDVWEEAIDRCAPGYLEMEEAAEGMVFDYDHAKFRSHKELEQMPWSDEQ
ncbi:hypothetical protein PFICI_08344 [Pestalotiopsis fici W106-1]|uniref:Uncharacterized protein n=1 Tax=Pestalotiopsis fici (strain W106-1 / CGMCC3.15140) TaxID=1229662 RepID=W3X431_PESFW|nr:uncharacterized protein PFICI_08344 [Pestalotiopsis fici W106-1]ETS80815.1 hypothetical protein PFICI_08344 [Pestalotiopsis fici W106-1]